MIKIKTYIGLSLLSLLSYSSYGQNKTALATPNMNDVPLTIDSAESQFLNNNLLLLAQKYNVDANKALEIQAKLYPNPNVQVGNTIYDPTHKKVFPLPLSFPSGEFTATLSQEIVLAGKLNKALKVAQANTSLSQYQFFDLIRTLKYALRSDFYNIYFLQQSYKVYNEEIENLQTVVTAYNAQEGKNYISEKEVVRVKAQLYSLIVEAQQLKDQINDLQSEIKLLLHAKADDNIIPQVSETAVLSVNPSQYPLMTMVDSAMLNRTDLLIAKENTKMSKLNYNYQKSLAVPNLTASVSYDQQGSMVNHLTSLGLAMDLPFFNRNQGNIKSAQAQIKTNEVTEQSLQENVENTVYRAYQKAIDAYNTYQKTDPSFGTHYEQLMNATLDNYKKRNIPLLDFLDFYESYKDNALQINNIKFNQVQSLENLNYTTGTPFFH